MKVSMTPRWSDFKSGSFFYSQGFSNTGPSDTLFCNYASSKIYLDLNSVRKQRKIHAEEGDFLSACKSGNSYLSSEIQKMHQTLAKYFHTANCFLSHTAMEIKNWQRSVRLPKVSAAGTRGVLFFPVISGE